jgi:hypothetical protein
VSKIFEKMAENLNDLFLETCVEFHSNIFQTFKQALKDLQLKKKIKKSNRFPLLQGSDQVK